MRILSLVTCLALLIPTFCLAQPTLTVTNVGQEAYMPVVELAPPPADCVSLVGPGGIRAALQQLADGRWFALIPGVLGPGEGMTLKPDTAPAATDLQVIETEQEIAVRNTFMALTFPKRGRGGLPISVTFPVSGHVSTDFQWLDRLYEKDQGQLMLHDDPEGTARVIESGPVQVVVETAGRYLKGDAAPGNARATYRWTFRASSPLVHFTAQVSREDGFAWPELHILQISRKDDLLRNWAGQSDGELTSGPLLDGNTGRSFTAWGALDDGENGFGLAWDGHPVSMYDGRTSYVHYLQYTDSFPDTARELTGRIYFGPARTPAGYQEEIMAAPKLTARWNEPPRADQVAPAGAITISNQGLSLGFDPNTLGCVSIRDWKTGFEFLTPADTPSLWALQLRDADGNEARIASDADCSRSHQLSADGDRLTLRWQGVVLPNDGGTADVTVEVLLAANDDRSRWTIDVRNDSAAWSIMDVEFPRISGISEPGRPKLAVPRSNWGILYPAATEQSGSYPSANWPMEFVSLHESESGLYLGYEDPGACPKSFSFRAGDHFLYRTPAPEGTRAGNDYRSPGPFALGVCGPDWWQAAKMYRTWALKQPWTSEGPLTTRESTPDFCKNLGLWFVGGGTEEQVTGNLRRAADFFGVPVGLHWYSWHRWPFDTHYPDYFPAIPDFRAAIEQVVPEGKVIMPYINGRIVDKDVDAFARWLPWTAKGVDGKPYNEVYGNGVNQAPMCPATEVWQTTISEICDRLIGEYGVNGIYIDQIAAAGPALCYDPAHGHPLGGGSWWVDGYRVLLDRVQEAAHRDGRNVLITTENNAEPYMDGVDCFLIWNPRHPDEIPMMTAVYSGYSIYFASNARCQPGLQPYAMIEGRDFIWGSQLGWMGFEDANPTERGNYLRQLVRLRHAALKYVIEGEIMGEIQPLNDVGTVTGAWHAWDGKPFDATLPAVMSTVWKGSDGTLGVFMANLSPRQKAFDFELDPARYGGVAGEGDCLLLTNISKEGNSLCGFSPSPVLERLEVLAPWEARVIEVRRVRSANDVPADLAAAPGAERFHLDVWAAQRGVEWEVELPGETVAERDWTGPVVRVKAPGLEPTAWCETGEGRRSSSDLNPDPDREGWLRAAVPVQAPALSAQDAILRATLHLKLDETHVLRVPWEAQVVKGLQVAVDLQDGGLRAGETAVVLVRLRNNRNEPAAAGSRVVIQAPAEWDIWPGRSLTFGAIEPKSEAVCALRCRVPANGTQGPVTLKAFVVESEASRRVDIGAPRPRFSPARLTPAIDGDLSEWAASEQIALGPGQAENLQEYGGPGDLSAKAWVAMDDTALYFAAEVTDNVHDQPNARAAMWQGDAIQLDFRPGNPPRRSTFDQVIEFGLALTPEGSQLWSWMPQERVVSEAQIQVIRDGDHTRYEAAIPWEALPGIVHAAGSVAAFSFTVNESDGGGFRGWLELTPGICGGKDASHFALLRF